MQNSDQLMQQKLPILQPGYLVGEVVHHRFSPREHRFTNRMYWHLVDINDLNTWSRQSIFRSIASFNVYGIYPRDYVNQEERPIGAKLNEFIQQQTGEIFAGRVLLMTHPRFMNIGFNSVSFYFCFEQHRLRYIVSEINNTPWVEKQLYFHDCQQSDAFSDHNVYTFNFDKSFHISPFVSMNIHYQWRFEINAKRVDVHMKLFKDDETIMYVGLKTKRLASDTLMGLPISVRRPAQAWKMWLNIYFQAIRLWLKKVPFYNHPDNQKP